jgi:polyhydroxyalkanoate synthase
MTQLAEAAVRSMIGPARATLAAVDHVRRLQGRTLDLIGLGPQLLGSRVLLATPTFRVRSYASNAATAPPLLLVATPIKRAYIWDLLPQASIIRLLANAGFAVYLLEWLHPEPSD